MTSSHKRKPALRGALAFQGLIALAVMVFALTPARGGTALYLPLHSDIDRTLGWARTEHAGFLATGPYAGAAFVRVPSPAVTFSALRHGALLFAVPETLCGSSPRNEPTTSS